MRHKLTDILAIVLLSLGVNFVILLFISTGQTEYLHGDRTNMSPDARHYILLGENFWLKGEYSRQKNPPYQPDILRTPVYPLLAGLMSLINNSIWPLFILQVLIATITALLVYGMSTWHLGRHIGLIAGLLCASDIMLATLNFQAMSEAIFIFLSTFAIFLWYKIFRNKQRSLRFVLSNIFVGLVIGLAILTRPAGLYLPIIYGIMEILVLIISRHRGVIIGPVVLVISAYLLVFPWILRNHTLYDISRLTTADTVNLLYFAGAGVYQVKYGIEREEAQAKIASDYNLVPLSRTNNFWLAEVSVATMDAKQRKAARDILTSHPFYLLKSTLAGILKAFISHNTNFLAKFSGNKWINPDLSKFLTGDIKGSIQRLSENHPFLIFIFLWQTLIAIGSLLLGLIGIISIFISRSQWQYAACLFAVMTYYMCTIAVVGIDASARHRSMIVPILCIFTSIGIAKVRDLIFYYQKSRL